jgi:hypothetical protein
MGLYALLGVAGLIFQRLNGFLRLRDVALGIAVASYPTVGALITSRQPRNPIGWMFCAFGLGIAASLFLNEFAIYALITEPGSVSGGAVIASVSSWLPITYLGGATFLPLLFPDGRVPPGWRVLAWLTGIDLTAVIVGLAVFPGPIDGFPGVDNPLGVEMVESMAELLFSLIALLIPLALLCWAALMDRFQHSSGVERQQLKWFTFAMAVAISLLIPAGEAVFATGWPVIFVLAGLVIPPIAVTNAMLQYHLYGIDVIIHRSLVYGALTGVLAIVYVTGVAGAGGLVRAITGQGQTDLVVAASTLAVAGLFRPARSRIQALIDRRFYRLKYDAAKTLDLFSTRLREQIDLESLSKELLGVVQDTMEPEQVSLWLREREGRTRQPA